MNHLLENLLKSLPPVIARTEVPRLLGGIISAGHLANLDCIGEGPPRIRVGRKVAYEREAFLAWLAPRLKPEAPKPRRAREV